jgi:D-xylose transport system substrate-binding protein
MKLFGRTSRKMSVLACSLFLTLMLVACGSANNTSSASGTPAASGGSNGKGCKKIGVLLPETATSARWDGNDRPQLEQQIPAALPGATVDYNNAQGSADTQLSQAEADLTKGDCILVVAPVDSVASAQIVSKAKAQGVPVIAYDRLIQTKDLAYYVSFDGVAVGKIQGQYIADHYKDYVTSGHVNTVMINGASTDNNAHLFYQGAIDVLQPLYSNGTLKKVYDQFTPGWDNPTAQNEMAGALTANKDDIQIAYVANDGMANSVIAALKAVKLNGKVLVTGQDATVAGIQNILTGDQAMTVEKNYALEAKGTAEVVAAISNGTSTASLTNGATTATSDGGNIPSILETPQAIDRTNFQQVVTDQLATAAQICSGLPKNAKYLPSGFCPAS